jgi:hypothetical protein
MGGKWRVVQRWTLEYSRQAYRYGNIVCVAGYFYILLWRLPWQAAPQLRKNDTPMQLNAPDKPGEHWSSSMLMEGDT